MPLYEYRCRRCARVMAQIRPIAHRNRVVVCGCGGLTDRQLSGVRVNAGWSPDWVFPNVRSDGDELGRGSFRTRAEYEAHLRKNHMQEHSLGIREV